MNQSLQLFEDSPVDFWALHPKKMPLNIFVAEHTPRIYLVDDADEIVEARIQRAELCGPQVVCFRPVRTPSMAH